MTAPRKIIIDTDPGQDDAAALMLAFASPDELDLLGITTVAGKRAALLHPAAMPASSANSAARPAGGCSKVRTVRWSVRW